MNGTSLQSLYTGKDIFSLGTSEVSISRGEGHVTHQSAQKALRYDASPSNRVMNNICGVPPHGTMDSRGNRANWNCFESRLQFLRWPIHYGTMIPNFIEDLIKVYQCRRILVPIVIWGIYIDSRIIILEYVRGLWRLNFSSFGVRGLGEGSLDKS
jgi:hypothetical protein